MLGSLYKNLDRLTTLKAAVATSIITKMSHSFTCKLLGSMSVAIFHLIMLYGVNVMIGRSRYGLDWTDTVSSPFTGRLDMGLWINYFGTIS